MNDEQTTIVWKLQREQKGRYVAAARKEGCSLVEWLARAADARSGSSEGDDQGGSAQEIARDRDDAGGMGETR